MKETCKWLITVIQLCPDLWDVSGSRICRAVCSHDAGFYHSLHGPPISESCLVIQMTSNLGCEMYVLVLRSRGTAVAQGQPLVL